VTNEGRWLLLLHHLPPNPPYLRAKVTRRLSQLGSLAIKPSVYVLPASDAAIEDTQWLAKEIREGGGDAWVLESRFLTGVTTEELRERFRAARTADYQSVEADARALLERARAGGVELDAERRRMLRRLEAIERIDFFAAGGKDAVRTLMATIEGLTNPPQPSRSSAPGGETLHARTWATRAGVKVDRMASAWLIRRFIDPAATFVFVPADAAPPAGALRFDMFEGEFTHDGDRCTFEVLLGVSGQSGDSGLVALAQIVHDIDLHDDRYQRPERAGVSAFVNGIIARFDDDNRRLAESAPFFETLYASLRGHA
jgi:hypothetical protein